MVAIEQELLTLSQWLLRGADQDIGALWWFLIVAAALLLVGMIFGFIICAARHGPMRAGDTTYRTVVGGFSDLLHISPRRVIALARFEYLRESMRRRVWVGLVVFIIILAFAGWFLDDKTRDPVNLYLSFVITATSYLVLLLSLFLSTFSLPNDFKNRTIYTVVTKPVFPAEIVLGRMLGFITVGTVLLAIMAAGSYFFMVRALHHDHDGALRVVANSDSDGEPATRPTPPDLNHRHAVVPKDDGTYEALTEMGHFHAITSSKNGEKTVHEIGPPIDLFQARIPQYGKLTFKDRQGRDAPKGISVGNEWSYRSYIEGGTASAAIWTFDGIDEATYGDGIPLEMYIRVFRSYVGEIGKRILGSIELRNPSSNKRSVVVRNFGAKDFGIDEQFIPRQLTIKDGDQVRTVDLFDEFVDSQGRIEVWIRCLNGAQYFGMAQADVYIRQEGGNFEFNLLKGFAGIWVQMVLVVGFGVMLSTFLSGPVAMLATVGGLILGFYTDFILGVVTGEVWGGGPAESLARTVLQMNVVVPFEDSFGYSVIKAIDAVALFFMNVWAHLLPNFGKYDNIKWVAHGFDIPGGLVVQHLLTGLSYLLLLFVSGSFFLRMREVAK